MWNLFATDMKYDALHGLAWHISYPWQKDSTYWQHTPEKRKKNKFIEIGVLAFFKPNNSFVVIVISSRSMGD